MVCPNPNCGRIHENVNGKCPSCDADFHGHVDGKRAAKPRDVVDIIIKCGHGILLIYPCPKCERSTEDCEVYRRGLLVKRQAVLVYQGVGKSEAWERAKEWLATFLPPDTQEVNPPT
jgi:hypothetical protein